MIFKNLFYKVNFSLSRDWKEWEAREAACDDDEKSIAFQTEFMKDLIKVIFSFPFTYLCEQ